jgi:hypothetical protein
MHRPNTLLRAARERLPSAVAPGEHASRVEVADAVNRWLWETTGRRHALDAHYLAKLERGEPGGRMPPTVPHCGTCWVLLMTRHSASHHLVGPPVIHGWHPSHRGTLASLSIRQVADTCSPAW